MVIFDPEPPPLRNRGDFLEGWFPCMPLQNYWLGSMFSTFLATGDHFQDYIWIWTDTGPTRVGPYRIPHPGWSPGSCRPRVHTWGPYGGVTRAAIRSKAMHFKVYCAELRGKEGRRARRGTKAAPCTEYSNLPEKDIPVCLSLAR